MDGAEYNKVGEGDNESGDQEITIIPDNNEQLEVKDLEGTTTPSIQQLEQQCVLEKAGKDMICRTHDKVCKKIYVSSKKWGDRGGGRGFGYIRKKIPKFQCGGRSMMSVGISDETSRNLNPKPGLSAENLTVVSGNNTPGGLEFQLPGLRIQKERESGRLK